MLEKFEIRQEFIDEEQGFKKFWRENYNTSYKRDKTLRLYFYIAAYLFSEYPIQDIPVSFMIKEVDGRFNDLINAICDYGLLDNTTYYKGKRFIKPKRDFNVAFHC